MRLKYLGPNLLLYFNYDKIYIKEYDFLFMVFYSDLRSKVDALREQKLSCIENVKYFLSNIEKNNKKYNIFLQVNDSVLEKAKILDDKIKKGEKIGTLFGLVFAIKAVISVKDMNISCSSNTLKNYKGTFDADIVKKIEAEDGLIIGMVNSDEFACGSSGETSSFGNTLNPFSPLRIPGGSSSGSAAAVAADMCDIAIGTDTGGSIRNPASHCGVCGVKPSYGLVSRYGLVDMAMSFDTIGPLSKDVYGSALVLQSISGLSENDATTINSKFIDYTKLKVPSKSKIGIVKSFDSLISDDRIRKAFKSRIEQLKKLDHEIIELDMKNIDLAIQTYYPIVYTEVFSGTRKFDGVKYGKKIEDTCNSEVLRRILGGKEISKSEYDGAYYKKALKVKEIISAEFKKAFGKVDFILTPVTPLLPHKFGTELTPEQMYAYDSFTPPVNLAGNCAGVVCLDKIREEDGDISVGMQVIADTFQEKKMFEGMLLLESLKAN